MALKRLQPQVAATVQALAECLDALPILLLRLRKRLLFPPMHIIVADFAADLMGLALPDTGFLKFSVFL